jgi:hypothetical protein
MAADAVVAEYKLTGLIFFRPLGYPNSLREFSPVKSQHDHRAHRNRINSQQRLRHMPGSISDKHGHTEDNKKNAAKDSFYSLLFTTTPLIPGYLDGRLGGLIVACAPTGMAEKHRGKAVKSIV